MDCSLTSFYWAGINTEVSKWEMPQHFGITPYSSAQDVECYYGKARAATLAWCEGWLSFLPRTKLFWTRGLFKDIASRRIAVTTAWEYLQNMMKMVSWVIQFNFDNSSFCIYSCSTNSSLDAQDVNIILIVVCMYGCVHGWSDPCVDGAPFTHNCLDGTGNCSNSFTSISVKFTPWVLVTNCNP